MSSYQGRQLVNCPQLKPIDQLSVPVELEAQHEPQVATDDKVVGLQPRLLPQPICRLQLVPALRKLQQAHAPTVFRCQVTPWHRPLLSNGRRK